MNCDTTSRLFGLGRAVNSIKNDPLFHKQASVFNQAGPVVKEHTKAGEMALISMCGGTGDTEGDSTSYASDVSVKR